ncbi:MAG: hypothetical protein PHC96_10460, partial [Firmicutes bacterium]|nr:hypothetical protein [Bacillota bacterium]
KEYTVRKSGKPTCPKGEPKTDIFVLAESNDHNLMEIKISFKKENADFIENKTNSERAQALLGPRWKELIIEATRSIASSFENKKLIYKVRDGRTEEGSITLGWKYELLNKSGGELSGVVDLTRDQVIDIYAGTHLQEDKRNASINGEIIKNSGIANYILMNDQVTTTQEVIDNMISVDHYVDANPTVYFACKALNYRTYCQKYDGNRPLSVYVDWSVHDSKLNPIFVYDSPLVTRGAAVAKKLKESMTTLGIKTTHDIDVNMVTKPSVILK